jgi:hypothetical protein
MFQAPVPLYQFEIPNILTTLVFVKINTHTHTYMATK